MSLCRSATTNSPYLSYIVFWEACGYFVRYDRCSAHVSFRPHVPSSKEHFWVLDRWGKDPVRSNLVNNVFTGWWANAFFFFQGAQCQHLCRLLCLSFSINTNCSWVVWRRTFVCLFSSPPCTRWVSSLCCCTTPLLTW